MIFSTKHTHTPVLLNEAVHALDIRPDGIYLDCTFGCGGHSQLILSKLNHKGRLLAIDRDLISVELAKKIKDPRFIIIHGLFSKIQFYMNEQNLLGKIDGILLDLGMSSLQLGDPKRGFSFMHNGPLDMRMDVTCGLSAAQWLLQANEKEIIFVLKNFGEERFAKRIAQSILKKNKQHAITHTHELVKTIISAIPYVDKNKHPATRTFQAIRIYINNELEEIKHMLQSIVSVLAPGGKLSVISFHSLEDRLIKHFIYNYHYQLSALTKFPLTDKEIENYISKKNQLINPGKTYPSPYEIKNNPCARSAILRFAEKSII